MVSDNQVRPNNRINLARSSRVRFWVLVIARAGYANRWPEKKGQKQGEAVNQMMSACGVLCSECPAYLAAAKGAAHQQQTADAWRRIYGLSEKAENISCGGCRGPHEDLFHTSGSCLARRCCRSYGFNSCAECPKESCQDLEKTQSLWDEVPQIGSTLSPADFEAYARAYCGHRSRLSAARSKRCR